MTRLFARSPHQRSKIPNEIARDIQRHITSGDLKGGDRLPSVVAMATDFKVSRASVREALQGLEALGLVEIFHGKGSFISHDADRRVNSARWIEEQQYALQELCELRLAVETTAARLAAIKATDEEIAGIQEAIDQLQDHIEDAHLVMTWDTEYHARIFKAARNRLLDQSLAMSRDLLTEARLRMHAVPEELVDTVVGHQAVLDAIRRRDALGASNAMREHLRSVEEGLGIHLP